MSSTGKLDDNNKPCPECGNLMVAKYASHRCNFCNPNLTISIDCKEMELFQKEQSTKKGNKEEVQVERYHGLKIGGNKIFNPPCPECGNILIEKGAGYYCPVCSFTDGL